MQNTHPQAIVTNARQGKPCSTRNRRKTGRGLASLAVVAAWVAVVVVIAILLAA